MLTFDKAVVQQGTFILNADIALEQGQKYAVIGPSGSGKSTLLNLACGFVPVESGRVLWCDREITESTPGARPMTMLFQDNNLFAHLSVLQNVGLGMRPDLRLNSAQKQRAQAAISEVGLEGYANAKPGKLSGGQQSRAALARVLVQAQPVVLLDEPFAALGPALRNEMLDLVDRLVTETGAMLIMVTHAPEDARRIADQVIYVEGGQVHAPQEVGGLLDNPPPELRAYLG